MPLPAGVLKPGRNVVVVRVLDTGGGGGIWGDQKLQLVFRGKLPAEGLRTASLGPAPAQPAQCRSQRSTWLGRGGTGSG